MTFLSDLDAEPRTRIERYLAHREAQDERLKQEATAVEISIDHRWGTRRTMEPRDVQVCCNDCGNWHTPGHCGGAT